MSKRNSELQSINNVLKFLAYASMGLGLLFIPSEALLKDEMLTKLGIWMAVCGVPAYLLSLVIDLFLNMADDIEQIRKRGNTPQ